MRSWRLAAGVLFACLALPVLTPADEPDAVERGRKALLFHAYSPTAWPRKAYDEAWRQWTPALKEKPADYDRAFRDYYGLHEAPFANDGYPMGLRTSKNLLGAVGLTTDCLLCHAGSVAGKSYVGLGNAALDIQALFEDLSKAGGGKGKTPFVFSNVRGTSEAGGMAVFLLGYRHPDLSLRLSRLELDLHDNLCEDVPAWWLLRRKKTMYHTGGTDTRSVRSLMQFMLTPTNGRAAFEKAEAAFEDIQKYLFSLEAPKYPLPIDRELAARGEKLFLKTCASCHGTYGAKGTYPSKVVPLDVIGTDRTRFDGITVKWGDYYNKSWFAEAKNGGPGYPVRPTAGYQAPPLDGVWATAPYFHNGSAPTVYHVLNSKARPKVFTRSYRTGLEDYDAERLGWKVRVLERGPDPA